MILLAHHEAGPTFLAMLITFAGPALLAVRCWLWDRANPDHHHHHPHDEGKE